MELYYGNSSVFVGTANHQRELENISGTIMDREFNYATPANDFKQSYIHREPNNWRWERSDAWIEHARKNNQILRLHGPISPQASKWVKEDNRTPQELGQMLDEFMIALCQRYADEPEVRWMDVVNETIAKDDIKDDVFGDIKAGDWFSAREGTEKWENPWTIIGYDDQSPIRTPLYIDRAFELSNQYAPKVKQIINQHGAFEDVVWEKIKELVIYLRERGRRVDGIGWQCHVDLGWELIPGNLERLHEFIKWAHDNELEFHITEMNVWLKGDNRNRFEEQADTYEAILDVLLQHQNSGVIGINFWNIRDEDTSNEDWQGCLWNNDGTAKPAYHRIKELLIRRGSTTNSSQSDIDGSIKLLSNPKRLVITPIDKQVEIFCCSGNNMTNKLHYEYGQNKITINLSPLKAGAYIVKSGHTTHKFVKCNKY